MATKYWVGGTSGNFGTAANWSDTTAPVNSDTLYITGSVSITAGLSTGLTGINLIVLPDYSGTIGTSAGYLVIGCASFSFAGTGASYIDVSSSNITLNVTNTAAGNPTTGTSGLYLKGSNIATLNVTGGYVGLAKGLPAETSTAATIRVNNANSYVNIGNGVTLTTLALLYGTVTLECAATTCNIYNGTLTTMGSGAITTVTQYAGVVNPYSSGTITTHNINGGLANYTGSSIARTTTTLKLNPGGTLVYDPAVLTLTNKVNSDYAVRLTASAP